MTENEARQLADRFIEKRRDWSFKFIGARKLDKRPNQWIILYETTNYQGTIFDGPTVVLVNEADGSVKYQTS